MINNQESTFQKVSNFDEDRSTKLFKRKAVLDSKAQSDKYSDSRKLEKLLNFLIGFSIFAIFSGLPIFYTGLSFQGFAFEKQIYFYFWLLLALIAWGVKGGYLGEMKIRKTPLDVPIILFWLAYLISTIASIDRWHSFIGFFGDPSRGFLSITALIVAYYLIISNFSRRLLKWIIGGFVFSGIVSMIWTGLAAFNLIGFVPESFTAKLPISLTGSLSNFTVLAGALIPALMMVIFNIQNSEESAKIKNKIYSLILILFLILDLFLLFALYAYVQWVGILTGSVLFLIFILAKIIRTKDVWALLPMIVFVAIITFLMVGKVNIIKENLPLSVSVPLKTAFEISKESIKEKPFFGYGAANYSYAFSKNLPENFNNMNVRFFNGEGLVLESLSTVGIVGTALFIILILTFVGVSLFLLSKNKEKNKIYSLGTLAILSVFLANSLIERADSVIIIFLALFGALSIAVLLFESNVQEKFLNFSLKASPKYALALSFVTLLIFVSVAFLFAFLGKIYFADIYMGKAALAGKVSEDGSVKSIVRAIELNGKEGRYYTRLGQEFMFLANEEMLKEEDKRDYNKVVVYVDNAMNMAKRGEDLMKGDVTVVEALAQIHENSRFYSAEALVSAEGKYKRALELEPNNPAFHVKLGEIKIASLNDKQGAEERNRIIEEAKGFFQKAISVRKNYAPAYYNIALIKESAGQLDEAVSDMNKAALIQKDNINYVFNLGRLYQKRGGEDDNKNAEKIFKGILGVNDKEINTHFNLGLLYEKTNRKSEAIEEYQKVADILPAGSEKTRAQIEKMIENIRNGVENTPENLGIEDPQSQQDSVEE